MNFKLSEGEILDSLRQSVFLVEQEGTASKSLLELSDLIPGVLHLNSLEDFTPVFFNKSGEEIFNNTSDNVAAEGLDIVKQVVHPDDLHIPETVLLPYVRTNDTTAEVSFFQRLRKIDRAYFEHKWYFTSCKIISNYLLCVSHDIRNLSANNRQLLLLLEENHFFRKNFRKFDALTKREKEILKELAVGKTAPMIAEEYFLSLNTVKTHRQRIFQKLEVKTFTELYKYAFHFDLL